MQKTQFPCRSHSGALDSCQYRPLALRTDHLQPHDSLRTNSKQKGDHPEAKSPLKRFFRFWEYWIMPANEGVELHMYCSGGNSDTARPLINASAHRWAALVWPQTLSWEQKWYLCAQTLTISGPDKDLFSISLCAEAGI